MGAGNARLAAELLQFSHIDALISWGTATALTNLDSGDLVLPECIIASDNTEYRADPDWHAHFSGCLADLSITIHTGNIADAGKLLRTPEQKNILYRKTGAIAADMESAAILKVARENRLPCLVIRSIIDRNCDSIPGVITRSTDQYGTPDIGTLLREIFCEPSALLQLAVLSRAMARASRTLRTVSRCFQEDSRRSVSDRSLQMS